MEDWRDVKGFEGKYQVSCRGRFRSLNITDLSGRRRRGRILKLQKDKYGYMRVSVTYEGSRTTLKVHREVAKAFIENKDNKPVVNHIDGAKHNNVLENLEWNTYSENLRHAIDTGLLVYETGATANSYKSPVKVFDLEDNYLYSLHGNSEMAERGFDYRLVSAVVMGKRKTHNGHKFRR